MALAISTTRNCTVMNLNDPMIYLPGTNMMHFIVTSVGEALVNTRSK